MAQIYTSNILLSNHICSIITRPHRFIQLRTEAIIYAPRGRLVRIENLFYFTTTNRQSKISSLRIQYFCAGLFPLIIMKKILLTFLAAISVVVAYGVDYKANVSDCKFPNTVQPGVEFTLPVTVQNVGNKSFQSATIELTIGTKEPITVKCNFAEPLERARKAECNITGTYPTAGVDIPLSMRITKLDENDNIAAATRFIGTIKCLSHGYEQNFVCEESTNVKCAYCPMGIVGLEKMKAYAPGRFIPIAIHNDLNGPDPLDVCGAGMAYSAFVSHVKGGNPCSFLNRDFSHDIQPCYNDLKAEYEAFATQEALCRIQATVTTAEDGQSAKLTTSTEFALDLPDADYGIAYTVVEDELGPYIQTNGFAGIEDDRCPEWGEKGSKVPTIYEDIAREGSCYQPISASLPIEITAETPISFDTAIDLSGLTKDTGRYHYGIVAMVINNRTGRVENAVIAHPADFDSLETLQSAEPTDVAPIYYNMQGVRLSQAPTGGIYIEVRGTKARTLIGY